MKVARVSVERLHHKTAPYFYHHSMVPKIGYHDILYMPKGHVTSSHTFI